MTRSWPGRNRLYDSTLLGSLTDSGSARLENNKTVSLCALVSVPFRGIRSDAKLIRFADDIVGLGKTIREGTADAMTLMRPDHSLSTISHAL